jgi:hypothetical protein
MARTMQQLCELLQTNKAHIPTCHTEANGACKKAKGVVINALSCYVNKQHSETVDLEPLVNEGALDKIEPKSDIANLRARAEQNRMHGRMKDHSDDKIKKTYQYKVEDRLYIENNARYINRVPKFQAKYNNPYEDITVPSQQNYATCACDRRREMTVCREDSPLPVDIISLGSSEGPSNDRTDGPESEIKVGQSVLLPTAANNGADQNGSRKCDSEQVKTAGQHNGRSHLTAEINDAIHGVC